MTGQTVEIRLKLLKMQGLGFSKAETVKQLVETFNITRGGAYYHFETLNKWASQYLDFDNVKDFQFNILNQLATINREMSFQYLQAEDDNAKIGYMRTRLVALLKLAEYAGFNVDTPTSLVGSARHLFLWSDPDGAEVAHGVVSMCSKEEQEFLQKAKELYSQKKIDYLNKQRCET